MGAETTIAAEEMSSGVPAREACVRARAANAGAIHRSQAHRGTKRFRPVGRHSREATIEERPVLGPPRPASAAASLRTTRNKTCALQKGLHTPALQTTMPGRQCLDDNPLTKTTMGIEVARRHEAGPVGSWRGETRRALMSHCLHPWSHKLRPGGLTICTQTGPAFNKTSVHTFGVNGPRGWTPRGSFIQTGGGPCRR